MPMINGDLSSCSDTSDISDDVPNSTYRSRNDICRDYLRNVCKRGDRCKYRHPSSEEAKSLGRQAQYTFCHDYQNSGCHRPNCKFMHCTRDEEDYYKQTGQLPVRLQQAAALGIGVLPNKLPLEKGLVPICKDYLKGECKRAGRCKFRHLSRTQYEALRNDHHESARASSPIPEQWNNSDTDYELYSSSAKRRRMDSVPNDYVSTTFQGSSLEEENTYLRRKVDQLKKHVSDLIATNEVLLEQNARYRASKANVVTTAPPIVTVSQVVTPTITPAPTMVRPALTPIQTSQQQVTPAGVSVLFEHHKSAEIITLSQPPPPTLAQPPPTVTMAINPPPPTVAMAAQQASNVIVPVSLTNISHARSMPTVSIATAMSAPPPLTMDCINAHPPQAPPPQTSLPTPQLLASAHNPALVSYPLISHAQQIPTSSMG